MPEADFPKTHTTETQAQGTATRIYLDLTVVKSLFGYLKIAEMAFSLLGFICILSSPLSHFSRGTWFNTVAMAGFWYSTVVLFLYVFHIPEKYAIIPWKKVEFLFCVVWSFFYLIAASLAANYGFDEAYAAAAFFGFVSMILYASDAWMSFTRIKGVIIVKTTTASSPTHY